jgi:alkyl hydroperoxide reductase subunit AhpF
MQMIADNVRAQLAPILTTLTNEVTILLFTQKEGCHFCTLARELLEELTALSGKLKLEIHDFIENSDLARKYAVDKTPAIALIGEKDYGIRFYGIPAGYEFTTFVEDLIDISKRDPGLPADLTGKLAEVIQPVHIQVMISPS